MKSIRNKVTVKFLVSVLVVFTFILNIPQTIHAYTTNMSASVVLGQPGFSTNTANIGGASASTLYAPRGIKVCNGKLIVADYTNNRVLIWNSVPTSNGVAADVVLGQSDFSSISANRGGTTDANTLSGPWDVECWENKLFVADGGDSGNRRVLIFNTIPTSNGVAADVVVGQASMTASVNHDGNDMDKLSSAASVATDGTKLVILDGNNQRFLIWNTIPTTNGATADVVVGSNHGEGCVANKLSGNPEGLHIADGRLFVGLTFPGYANRVLIWNSIPTTNNQSADVVVGQPDFVTCNANNGGIGANTLSAPFDISTDSQGRMLIADKSNQRVLVYNSVPTSNGVSANLAIGQASFTTSSANQGGSSPASNTLSGTRFMTAIDNKIIVSDGDNHRILIFDNVVNNPGLTLNESIEGRDNGILRFSGTASLSSSSSYTISNVQYSINNSSFAGAVATDGNFNSIVENYYFDFNPVNSSDGYTIRVKSTNTNLDITDHFFYFQPFILNDPVNNAVTVSSFPTFDFSVIRQKDILKDNLSKYQIQIKVGGANSRGTWKTLIDDIPIEGSNTVENDKFKAIYTDDSSRIRVNSKTNPVMGTFQWKVVAVDKAGHTQDSSIRYLTVNNWYGSNKYLPLTILNISSIGNPNISTNTITPISRSYYLSTLEPTFFGTTYANSEVNLKLNDTSCDASKYTNCTKSYSTITNSSSMFGINIPKYDLRWGKKYEAILSVYLNQDYNELPPFIISTSGNFSKATVQPKQASLQKNEPKANSQVNTQTVTPTSVPRPNITPSKNHKKRCFIFFCF